ncbi:Pentatricopeptide repeat-containing protein, chloroplastic [Glycine soja]
MEPLSFSTSHLSVPSNTTIFSPKHHPPSSSAATTTTTVSFSLKPPSDSNNSATPRRPSKSLKATPATPPSNPKPAPISNPLANKLWLTSKLSPPPPPPPPPPPEIDSEIETETDKASGDGANSDSRNSDFRQPGKIFVGNLPAWVKKPQVAEFFRQFGPIRSVILIKGHHDTERSAGFAFVIYDGVESDDEADKAAMRAVEFDGVEFHGRVLTVKLDDGKRMRERSEEKARWLQGNGGDKGEYPSTWHEERDGSRKSFQKILETQPENWQAVVTAFERIKKPARKEYGLMVKYYGRRGDMHHARQTFESMRARGIEPSSHVYSSLIHAYAVGRDMEEALHCVRKMKEEGIEMTIVTYSIIVGGFAKMGNADAADHWFEEAKEKLPSLNAVIYGGIIYAHCQICNMDRAEALVREMEEQGIDAPIDIYHTMMDGYTMIGNEEKCLIVFDRLKECGFSPSVISYGCLINLYTKVGKVSKALEISKMMKMSGIKHNMKTYSMLINGFLKLKDWANAFSVFEDFTKDGLKPDVVLYNNIITAFCGMGNMDRAICMVRQMQKERHRPTTRTFLPIIHGFARAGEMRRALEIFDMMRRSGCIPTVHTYNALILGLVEKRQRFLSVEDRDTGVVSAVYQAWEEQDQFLLAWLQSTIAGEMLPRSTSIWFSMVFLMSMSRRFPGTSEKSSSGKSDPPSQPANPNSQAQMTKAVAILDEMNVAGVGPNEHTYTTLMQGYASLGDTEKAFQYFTVLRNEGLEIDVYTYEALLKSCCKSGRMQSALAVTKEMSAKNIPRNTFVYNILIDGNLVLFVSWARRGDVWEAADLMQQMRKEGLLPDIHTYTSFINACCKAGDMQKATEIIQEMEASGIKPNLKTYTTLINGWARASMPEKALSCFEEMKLAGFKPDKAVYHCLMTSLLSRATFAQSYVYSGLLSVCREMIESEMIVDMGTAVHWSRCLRKIERTGGELTEALQKTFPPDWTSHNVLDVNSETETADLQIDDEDEDEDDVHYNVNGINNDDDDTDDDTVIS